jgi:ADP-ribose pyrophosphatase YjhB (NUDIX family)
VFSIARTINNTNKYNMNMCTVPYGFATGHISDNKKWVWEQASWSWCPKCSIYHSNRHVPDAFWHRTWAPHIGKRRTSGVIIVRGDSILLVQSYGDKYGFPKGSVEEGETSMAAAERELLEETGLKIDLSSKRKIVDESKYKLIEFFIVMDGPELIIENLPKYTQEISSIGYVPMSEINSLSLNSNTKYIYNRILKL